MTGGFAIFIGCIFAMGFVAGFCWCYHLLCEK